MALSPYDIVSNAKQYLGVPYVFGGTSPKGLDCSGLVQLVYKNLGVNLPRLVRDQRNQGRAVNGLGNAQPGDLLVFNGYQHIGIYVGGGKMIAAPQPGEKVKIQSVYAKPTSIRRVIGDGGQGAGQDLSGIAAGSKAGALAAGGGKVDMETLAARYGYSMAFFKHDASLWTLINQAVGQQMTPDEFGAQLKNTTWYKTYGDTYRAWRTLEHIDSATALAKMAQTRDHITQLAGQQGITLDPKRMQDMVWRINAYGWDEGQIAIALANEMKFDPNKTDYYGGLAIKKSEITKQAEAYGVQISEQTTFNLMQQLVGQRTTDEGVTEYIKKLAKTKYTAIADDIDRGMTVADYASPYIQSQARLLELNPADVNLMDPHIQQALQYKDPSGKAAPETLFNFETRIRNDGRWTKTKNGRDSLMDGARQVLADWGLN